MEAIQLEAVSDEDGLSIRCSGDDERRDLYPPSKIVRAKKSKAAAKLDKGLADLAEPKMKIRSGDRTKMRRVGAKQRPEYLSGPSSGTDISISDEEDSDDPSAILAPAAPATDDAAPARAPAPPPADVEDEDDPNVITWRLPDVGVLKLSIDSMMLAAHCPHGGKCQGGDLPHSPGPSFENARMYVYVCACYLFSRGPCRLNRSLAKGPVGFLAAWLQAARPDQGRAGHSLNTEVCMYMQSPCRPCL